MFPEALMLHYLDDLDSKMEAMRAHFERESTLMDPGPATTRRWAARCSIPRSSSLRKNRLPPKHLPPSR